MAEQAAKTSGHTLAPTHTCFDDALDFVEMVAKNPRTIVEDYVIVHAICRAPDGNAFAHAWVEHRNRVFHGCMFDGERCYLEMLRTQFQLAYRPLDATRYGIEAALAHNARSGHYGPWEPRYRDLVANGDRVVWKVAL